VEIPGVRAGDLRSSDMRRDKGKARYLNTTEIIWKYLIVYLSQLEFPGINTACSNSGGLFNTEIVGSYNDYRNTVLNSENS